MDTLISARLLSGFMALGYTLFDNKTLLRLVWLSNHTYTVHRFNIQFLKLKFAVEYFVTACMILVEGVIFRNSYKFGRTTFYSHYD